MPLFAVEIGEAWLAAFGVAAVGVIGALGTWVVKIRQADGIERRADVVADRATKASSFGEMQKIVTQLTKRLESQDTKMDDLVETQNKKMDVLSLKCAACESRESVLIERLRWLETTVGKTSDSKAHTPLSINGANL